jgi:hypothetical protein
VTNLGLTFNSITALPVSLSVWMSSTMGFSAGSAFDAISIFLTFVDFVAFVDFALVFIEPFCVC